MRRKGLWGVMPALAVAAMPVAVLAQPGIQLLADTCAICHGTDGVSPGTIDSLDDIEVGEFVEEMREFKYEVGEGRIMRPIARGLSDDQINALAEHFQSVNR